MARVLEMPLDDGGTVLVEVTEDDHAGGIDRVGRPREIVRETAETLQQALSRVGPAAAAVLESVRGMVERPDRVKVEFGVKLTAEAGVVVARAATEGNFKVSVEWSVRGPAEQAEQ